MPYYCSECKLAVIVIAGHPPIKPCKCNASIIAEASAQATGSGNLSTK